MMKATHRLLLSVMAALAGSLPASAQFSAEKFQAEPGLFFGNHHVYVFKATADTPAPEGYEPFYISHIGRHGSRRNTGSGNHERLLRILEEAEELDLLTAAGDTLLAHVYRHRQLSDEMYGMLSERGAREHREIAARMFSRFPAVFGNEGRKEVFAASSQSERCLISMACFVESLKGMDPLLHFDIRTGPRYMKYIMKATPELNEEIRRAIDPAVSAMRREGIDRDRILRVLFTDVETAKICCKAGNIISDIYSLCNYEECLDLGHLRTSDLLTFDELYTLSRAASNRLYTLMCNSVEYGDRRIRSADDLLRDIVTRADAALAPASRRAADLRFSHDYALLPLLSLIGTEGMDVRTTQQEADRYWCAGEMMPMAANLQMIFYRHPGSDTVLVKLLHNERETCIPSLDTDIGPYYRWDRLRTYLEGKYD
ncbi:MAG: histidine-type phosphatase [Bacteroidales bacterium]|nr:histidine-type phosphatase [Bacteroidales bacterium]